MRLNDHHLPLISGEVVPGFEAVRDAFEENFQSRGELGAACAVYHRGRKVVDLWGGAQNHQSGDPWSDQTLTLTFSVTKGMAAAAMVVAHAQGLFELDAPVATYWPEFAQGGKQSITVRELLCHQAGLVGMDQKLTPEILADHDRMAEIVSRQRPLWAPGTRHGYHTLTLGWYQGELIRRVDPQGRSLGRFFQEEIAGPLGVEFYIGLPGEVCQSRLSKTRGFPKRALLANMDQLPWKMVMAGIWPRSVVSRSINFLRVSDPATLASEAYRAVEIPSANGFGQARAVAKVYDALVRGSRELGLDSGTLRELFSDAPSPSGGHRDAVMKIDTNYQFGFSKPSQGFPFGADTAAFGCPGAGGSFGMADPARELSFAYLTNTMSFRIFDDPRERAVRHAMYRCVEAEQPVETIRRAA